MTGDEFGTPIEVEATTVEEFLRLLKEREESGAYSRELWDMTRKAVFVAQMLDRRSSRYSHPVVHRYVVAAFANGHDAVSYRRTTSNAVELPEVAGRTEERQQAAYEEIRAEIERGLGDFGLDLPVYEGLLRHAADNGRVRRDENG
jgi:hypothetical protein